MEKFPSFDDACRQQCFNLRVLTSRITNKKWVGIKAIFCFDSINATRSFMLHKTWEVWQVPGMTLPIDNRHKSFNHISMSLLANIRGIRHEIWHDRREILTSMRLRNVSEHFNPTHIVTTLCICRLSRNANYWFDRSARLISFSPLHVGIFSRPLIIRAATEENQNANHAWLFVSEIVQRHQRQMMVINESLVAEVRIE